MMNHHPSSPVPQWHPPALLQRPWVTALVIIAATAGAMVVNGYVYGIYDHTYHLSRLNWLKDPTLYSPNDPFVHTFSAFTSIFWHLLVPLTSVIPQPMVFFGLYFVGQCLFGYMVLRFTRQLYASESV